MAPLDTKAWQEFETSLDREVLAAERLRVTIVATLVGMLLAMSIVVMAFLPGYVPPQVMAAGGPLPMQLALGFGVLFELAVRRHIGWCMANRRPLAEPFRYATAFVEVSLPTTALVWSGITIDPAVALNFTPAFAYFLFLLAATLRMDFRLSVFTGGVAAGQYLLVGLWALSLARPGSLPAILLSPQFHLSKCMVLFAGGVVSGLVGIEIKKRWRRAIDNLQDRNRVLEVFGQHVSPEVVDRLLAQHVGTGTEVRHVCVMFLDIRGFTAFSEGRQPAEVVAYLNQLFAFMIEAVNRNHGIVNKFLGDGFMAVFGAPLSDGQNCKNAVVASQEMLAEVKRLVATGELPPTRVGIGLHAGEAVTGNVGSAQRKEYTIIGDVVNLASRIEAMNKEFGSTLLVSGDVVDGAGDAAAGAQDRGEVAVRGRVGGVRLFQLGE